jgi:ABC-2 type transport system ATP-binding protein
MRFRLSPEAPATRRPYGHFMNSTAHIEQDTLAVQTDGLGKRFGTRAALDGVDLEVPRGAAFGFLGPNGAGKTTLIRLLLGLAEPTAGRMRLLGRDLPAQRAVALARVGAIIEEPRFHPHLTGRENLAVHAAARDRSAHARIDGALARVGLAARADDRVKAYSLGMRQRLGIARGLLADPELLILDEPMNGLDPAGILEFRRLIRELVGEGRTVLLSSHLLDEVEKTCDLAAIVDQGRVVAQGPIHELVRGGPRAIDIVSDNPVAAASLLAAVPGVTRAGDHDGGLRVTLSPEAPVDREIVTELLRRLLDHGVSVERVTPVAASLEDRFLSMTTRLEDES